MRIIFLRPSMSPPGGGSAVAAWMLQALAAEHEVTVLSWWPMDVDGMNRFWGTSLRSGDFTAIQPSARLRRAVDRLPLPLSMLRTAFLVREARRRRASWDLPVSVNDEMDFGTAGVQYVNYPWNSFPRPEWQRYPRYQVPLLLRAYWALCQRVSPFTLEGSRRNVTLSVSNWTGRLMRERYGYATRTVYPPVTSRFPDVPWEARAPGFVCIGRIAPEKELDRVIDIVDGVRRRAPEVTLHVVGTPDDPAYYRHIAARVRAAGFTLHESLSRAALVDLVSRQRYGIHGMREEHFGIAPAELVRGGCLVWVPDGGGQVEIVDEPRLTYHGVEDAVARILAVIGDPHEVATLRKHLAARAEIFSAERFMREVRAAVADAARAA